ncbi:MAG: ATP-binding protein [Armatimonadota bacterium]
MSFAEIVGHEQPIEILRRAVAEDRVATAYLLVGPPNIGKSMLAIEFAKAVNCERRAAGAEVAAVDACDQCHNCIRIGQENHPDLLILRPAVSVDVRARGAEELRKEYEEAGEQEREAEDEADQARERRGKRKVYIELPDALIDTDRMQHVVEYSYAKRAVARRKFVIVVSAEAMNAEAASRLLKTLEEPPPDTTFVLTTARLDKLLPTTVSRCQMVRCHALSRDALRAALAQGFPNTDAGLLDAVVAMASGRYGRARRLIDAPALVALRAELLDLAAATFDANLVECLAMGERLTAMPSAWWEACEEAEASAVGSADEQAMRLEALEVLFKRSPDRIARIQMREILDVLQTWYRDLTLLRAAPGSELVINADRHDQLAAMAPGYSPEGLVWASAVIEEARRELTVHNANLRLACQVLMVKLIAARRRR